MNLFYSAPARTDLQGIREYVSVSLHNRQAAERILRRIADYCNTLKAQPKLGMSLAAKVGIDTDLRYLLCGNYLISYRIQNERILIVRILDGRTDYLRQLFGSEVN